MANYILFHVLLIVLPGWSLAQLSSAFYAETCQDFGSILSQSVTQAVNKEPRMAASLLRLHFHDCFVQGCDASILLDDTSSFTGEKGALPNSNSVRGFEVIDTIKQRVESKCKGVVSCADIVAGAAMEAVLVVGGPKWVVRYGRRDSRTASLSSANSELPFFNDTIEALTAKFKAKGHSIKDLVVLSGGHTIGQSQCVLFRDRIYANKGELQPLYREKLKQQCPQTSHDRSVSPLDSTSPNHFDNIYFKLLQLNRGILESDQVLYSAGGTTKAAVDSYSSSQATFFKDFVEAMLRMGSIKPLTGVKGEIRNNCRFINS